MSASRLQSEYVHDRLIARRAELAGRNTQVVNDLARRNEPLVGDFSDRAIQTANDETLDEIGAAARSEIEAIDRALERISQGLYGICKSCGDEIQAARLNAVPYAVTCLNCANG